MCHEYVCVCVCFYVYLVCAPVPGCQYGESQGHARPGQISSGGISEQMHGVLAWQVAGTIGDDLTGHRHTVHALQVTISTDLVKGCEWDRHTHTNNSNCTILTITYVFVCGHLYL